MSETRHTPGPWVSQPCDATDITFVVAGAWPLGSTVCEIDMQPREGSPEANARLIAAAPDMLEALQRIAEQVHNEHADLDDIALMATRAIEKAEGRSVVPHECGEK